MKIKRFLFISVSLVCCSLGLDAHDFEANGIFYNITSFKLNHVEVTYPDETVSAEYSGEIVIPERVVHNGKTYLVKSVGEKAFSNNKKLTGVVLPNSVTHIKDYAFDDCYYLQSVNIPSGVKTIGEAAFNECMLLRSIAIPNSVESIGGFAFNSCFSLENIEIPNSVTSIGSWTFYDTPWYDRQPDGPVYIGNIFYKYKGDTGGVTSFTVRKGTVSISEGAFANCKELAEIKVPNSVVHIASGAFTGTIWYDKQPDGPIYLGRVLYKYKGEMPENTHFEIREGTVAITGNAFEKCAGLTAVTLPKSIKHIGSSAFSQCANLESIEIPESVTNIGEWVFNDCSGLNRITVNEHNPVYDSRNNCNAIIETATHTLLTGCQNTVIPNDIVEIGEVAFGGCRNLSRISLPNTIESIGDWAFRDCENLVSVHLPQSMKKIGTYAFCGCKNLIDIQIPPSVTKIREWTFSFCESLTSVVIPDNVTYIEEHAFSSSGLEKVVIGSGIKLIDSSVFGACYNMTDVYCYATKCPKGLLWNLEILFGQRRKITLYVPKQSLEHYKEESRNSGLKMVLGI